MLGLPRELGLAGPVVAQAVGRGETWENALDDVDWEPGDVLVVGSSSIGPLARVFLGSRSERIVSTPLCRPSPCRAGVSAELADEAASAV